MSIKEKYKPFQDQIYMKRCLMECLFTFVMFANILTTAYKDPQGPRGPQLRATGLP